MPVEVIGSMYGAAALLLLAAGYFFAGGTPALVGAGEGYRPGPKKERPAWADTLMFFGGGGGSDGSDEIRRQEEARQRRVRQSTERINRIFDQFKGIDYQAVNPIADMSREEYNQAVQAALDGNVDTVTRDVTRTEYRPYGDWRDGKGVTKTVTDEVLDSAGRRALQELGLTNDQIDGVVGLNGLNGLTARERFRAHTENARRRGAGHTDPSYYQDLYQKAVNNPGSYQRVNTGNSLYDQYREDYLDYYQPQLKDQYQDAQSDVMFDLARRGATESSAGQQKLSDLLEAYNKQQTLMQNQATNAVNDYRGSIEQQRQSLISQAQAGMAPTDAANLASNAFNQLQAQTPEYSALGDVFSQFADVYGMGLRAQGAGFQGYNQSSGGAAGLPGRSGTAKIRS